MADISEQNLKMYARIFADEFKKMGVLSSNIDSSGTIGGNNESVKTEATEKKRRLAMERSNKTLKKYMQTHAKLNKANVDEKKIKDQLMKFEKSLNKESELAGRNFVRALDGFNKGLLDSRDILDLVNDSSKAAHEKDFTNIAGKMKAAGESVTETFEKLDTNIKTKFTRVFDKMDTIGGGWYAVYTTAMLNFGNEFKTGMERGVDLTRSFNDYFDRSFDALRMGIGTADLIRLETDNKRLSNVLGGADRFRDIIATGSDAAYQFYGDLESSTRGVTQALTALTYAGIKPNMEMVEGNNRQFNKLNEMMFKIRDMTGATFAEQNAIMNEYIQSEEGRVKLINKSTQSGRFQQILTEQANRKYLHSLGLTTEQARLAADTLGDLVALKPQDRLKKSYEAQASLAAMGVKNAEAFGEVMRVGGVDNVSKEVREKYFSILQDLAQMDADSRTGEITGRKMVISNLLELAGVTDKQIKSGQNLILADRESAKETALRAESSYEHFMKYTLGDSISSITQLADMFLSKGSLTNSLLGSILGTLLLMSKRGAGMAAAAAVADAISSDADGKGNRKKGIFGKLMGVGKSAIGAGVGMFGASAKFMGDMAKNSKLPNNTLDMLKSGGGKVLGIGSKILGKLALPVALATSATDAVSGFNAAGNIFETEAANMGMKMSSAVGGIVDGLTFGLLDRKTVSKTLYSSLGGGMPNSPNKKLQRVNDNVVSSKTPQEKADVKKGLALQEELIALYKENIEMSKKTNDILVKNFDRMNANVEQQSRTNEDIKTAIENVEFEGQIIESSGNDMITIV